MDQKHFRNILGKYLRNRATMDERKIIDSWYASMGEDPERQADIPEEIKTERKYWTAVDSHISRSKTVNFRPTVTMHHVLAIAASVLLCVVSYLFVTRGSHVDQRVILPLAEGSANWKIVRTPGNTTQAVTLPDGSKVTLEPHSQIKFSASFDEVERIVTLEGGAFFEVAHNKERPFLVQTNNLTTKVLGTSFSVKAFQGEKDVVVSVKTGKVSVYINQNIRKDRPESPEVILTPNQKIVYDKTKDKLSKAIVDSPQVILSEEEVKRMRFEAAPVTEIFEAIEKVYGVDLVFDADKFSGCTLTSVISDGDLYNRLDIICKAIGATYSLNENQIVINGSGCNNP
jgi:transmembrane sensor